MNKKFSILLIVVLLLAVGLTAFFTLKLDKPIFEAKVRKGIEEMHERAIEQGRDLQITYDSLDVQGNWFKRQSIIRNISIVTRTNGTQIELSAPQVIFAPESPTFASYRVEIPSGVKVKENGGAAGTLTYNTPVIFTSEAQGGDTVVSLDLPTQMTYTNEDAPSQALQIALAGKPVITQRNDKTGMPLSSHVALDNIKISSSRGEASIAQVAIDMKNQLLPGGGKHDVSYVVNIKDIAVPVGMNPYGPFTIVLNANYVGEMPKDMQMPTLTGFRPQEFELKMNEISLTAKDFGIAVKGDVSISKTDPMPTGNGSLHVENMAFMVRELLNTQALSQEDIGRLDPIVAKITGTPLSETKNLDIAFERKPGDVLHVGNATGDEVLMLAMPLFASTPPPSAENTPVPDKTAPAGDKASAHGKSSGATSKTNLPSPTPPSAAISAPVTPVVPSPVATAPAAGTAPSPVAPSSTAKEASPAAARPATAQ